VLIDKNDGSIRLCVDYRKLNDITQSDGYPIPRIDEIIPQMIQVFIKCIAEYYKIIKIRNYIL
jgi:hypothetical protein